MFTGFAKKATKPYRKIHRSGNVSWCLDLGKKNDGRRDIRTFASEAEANHFRDEWNLKLIQKNSQGLSDLSAVARHEILAAIAKLEAVHATLPEAVEFFLKFARPPKGNILITEAIHLFLRKKAKAERAAEYLRTVIDMLVRISGLSCHVKQRSGASKKFSYANPFGIENPSVP